MSAFQAAPVVRFQPAVALAPASLRGLSIFAQQTDLPRKAPAAVTLVPRLEPQQQVFHLDLDKAELRRSYVFTSEASVWLFLVAHSAIRATLRDALPHLQAAFGTDRIFCLQLSKDEDGSPYLYAVAVWQGPVQSAVRALRQFEEDWWLDRMTPATAELAFVYEIA